jgi:DNA-directed RNA polymerase subunit RPC12/RpoP
MEDLCCCLIVGVIGIVVLYYFIKSISGDRKAPQPPFQQPTPQQTYQQPQFQPAPQTTQIIREREITREIVKVRCQYCGSLYDERENRCPDCGAR